MFFERDTVTTLLFFVGIKNSLRKLSVLSKALNRRNALATLLHENYFKDNLWKPDIFMFEYFMRTKQANGVKRRRLASEMNYAGVKIGISSFFQNNKGASAARVLNGGVVDRGQIAAATPPLNSINSVKLT